MNALKNASHLAILAVWVVLGVLFSLKTFGGGLIEIHPAAVSRSTREG